MRNGLAHTLSLSSAKRRNNVLLERHRWEKTVFWLKYVTRVIVGVVDSHHVFKGHDSFRSQFRLPTRKPVQSPRGRRMGILWLMDLLLGSIAKPHRSCSNHAFMVSTLAYTWHALSFSNSAKLWEQDVTPEKTGEVKKKQIKEARLCRGSTGDFLGEIAAPNLLQ